MPKGRTSRHGSGPVQPYQPLRKVTAERWSNAGDGVKDGSDYTPDEVEFMMAMDSYKRVKQRPHPTMPEVLVVAKALGYRVENA